MQWPHGLTPAEAPVYARNEMVIDAELDVVWRWLISAQQWPAWYPNCNWLGIERGSGAELRSGTRFVWKTFGVVVRSTVRVFEPPTAIEWDARALWGTSAYHGWTLTSLSDQSTRVITEETQTGILPWVGRALLRRRLWRGHQLWLRQLSLAAASGHAGLTRLVDSD